MVCGMSSDLHTGAGLCRSGRSAIPCGGYAGCSWTDWVGLPVVGTPSAIPSVWVGVCPVVVLDTSRCEVLHLFAGCIRCTDVDVCWSEQDGECSGSDLDVWRCTSRA